MTIQSTARDNLGLNIIKPDEELYVLIKTIYDNISEELGFGETLDPRSMIESNNGEYTVKRGIVESLPGGSNMFISQGKITLQQINTPAGIQQQINDNRIFEGWRQEANAPQ